MPKAASALTRRHFLVWTGGAIAGARFCPAVATESADVSPQPYFAGVYRALEALAKLGAPIAPEDAQQLSTLARHNDSAAVAQAEKILERYTLTRIQIESDGYARATAGGAQRTLVEQGWRLFLVRVANPMGSTDKLASVLGTGWPGIATRPLTATSTGASRAGVDDTLNAAPLVARNWVIAQLYDAVPMVPALSGFSVEYRVIQLYSRDHGRRAATIDFYTASAEQAPFLAAYQYRRGVRLDFECLPSQDVALSVLDTDGRGCMASLTIKDKFDRIYPLQAMRLAPDMQFQPQIYRADGETVRLPAGEYTVESKRGPEYLRGLETVTVDATHERIEVKLQRWIDPSQWGWYSGDTHIHAGGCAHYERPTEGVSPETMIRHVRGEALSIGDVLTWGPSWYYQKQFFSGQAESPRATLEHPELQVANNASWQPRPTPEDSESLLRYDVVVSGFPSSHCGHLVLLGLKDQDYPRTKVIQDWPSWNLPILQWARSQGAVAGYAHCGSGMEVESSELPNYAIPPMDGIGTQEAIVDVTHGYADFISGCDTQPTAELNAWYHMLNCGFRLALTGETDYPCITGDRPGKGRSYVRLEQRPVGNDGYEAWVRNLQKGNLYCGDGRSHILEFKVNGRRSGDADLSLKGAGQVSIEALVAARLEANLPDDIKAIKDTILNGWHLENARIGTTRDVPVELIVNGSIVERATLFADGTPRSMKFKTPIVRSSWVALRILPSAHTHPIFVQVTGKPIRASKRSAQWCRICVDKVWEVKSPFMRESERPMAAEAFDHARKTYDKIIDECEVA
jgi:hypothetical protein